MDSDPFFGAIESAFSSRGGAFVTPAARIAARAAACRGLVFDWDGVFNPGAKGQGATSSFSEADSMGVNLLRFALWRASGRLPIAAVVTGEENPTARRFATREHFDVVYSGVKNKVVALEHLCSAHGVEPQSLIAIFDDVNDLGMAARCGVRVLVRRDASPLLREYAVRHGLVDYVTAASANEHPVREASELLLGVTRAFDAVVGLRIAWDSEYARYFEARQAVETRFEHAS
jgi:3-deoxy-D-manno-octulosonate 8-phosphate phosphatase (KDO 8-P phosphatase)